MSILVTGGAGYIGSHVVIELLQRGEDVVVIDNLSTGFADAISAPANFIKGDTGDQAFVQNVIKSHRVTEVLHFAASTSVPGSIAAPVEYYSNNTASSIHLLRACLSCGVERFIFSSTAAVYGASGQRKFREDDNLLPVTPYGSSKLMIERVLNDIKVAHPMKFIILRYFNVAGADSFGRAGQRTLEATHLIKVASEVAMGRRDGLTVFGTDYDTPDGTCVRDYIHVSDLANAHAHALDYLRSGGDSETFNCGYGRGYSVKEVIEAIEKILERKLPVKLGDRRPGDMAYVVADSEKIRRMTGWTPRHQDLTAIVASAINYERKRARETPNV